MIASEAREIANNSTNNDEFKVRKKLDTEITKAANKGKGKLEHCIYDVHDCKRVVQMLKDDGFKARCEEFYDQRDHFYTYIIGW